MHLSEIASWIDQNKPEIEHMLWELVEINTYTTNQPGVDAGMSKLLEFTTQMGFETEFINERHLLIKTGDGKSRPRIMLVSHMDTVFPPDGDFLHYEVLPDGYVRGPGVGDIKGGLVMGLWALKALTLMTEHFDVQMLVSADEENGSPTIRDWYLKGHIGADYAIALEPGFPQGELSPTVPLGVVYQRRGYGAIQFKVHGKACHSGTPNLGLNAAEAAAHRVVKMAALNAPEKNITVNLGRIQGGISPNTVPGMVEAAVSFRYSTQADGEATKAAIEKIITDQYIQNAEINLWDSAEYTEEAFIPPMEWSPENQKLVDIVLEEAKRLEQNVVPIARGGGSDANFTSASGTPSICGMGAPAHGIHTTEEKIYLPMMFERINLLASSLYRMVTA